MAVDFTAIVLHEFSIASVSMASERGHLGGRLGSDQGQKGRGAREAGLRAGSGIEGNRIWTKARGDKQEPIHLESF